MVSKFHGAGVAGERILSHSRWHCYGRKNDRPRTTDCPSARLDEFHVQVFLEGFDDGATDAGLGGTALFDR